MLHLIVLQLDESTRLLGDSLLQVFDREGTLAPALRASDSPIAIACLRLLTFLPDLPDLSFPSFISCIDRSTLEEAFLLYFRD
jgi:hypothetical protein